MASSPPSFMSSKEMDELSSLTRNKHFKLWLAFGDDAGGHLALQNACFVKQFHAPQYLLASGFIRNGKAFASVYLCHLIGKFVCVFHFLVKSFNRHSAIDTGSLFIGQPFVSSVAQRSEVSIACAMRLTIGSGCVSQILR